MPTISLPQRSNPVTDSVRKDMSGIWHTYDMHIHSPRNDKRSFMQAESESHSARGSGIRVRGTLQSPKCRPSGGWGQRAQAGVGMPT